MIKTCIIKNDSHHFSIYNTQVTAIFDKDKKQNNKGHQKGHLISKFEEIPVFFYITCPDLTELWLTWREMENLNFETFIRIFGEIIEDY